MHLKVKSKLQYKEFVGSPKIITAEGILLRRKMYMGQYSLPSDIARRCSYSYVRIQFAFWQLKRDERSGVLIGAAGTLRSDWPERA